MQLTSSRYTGEHRSGRMEGQGKFFFSSGTMYEGGMKDGLFHGEGKIVFVNGDAYEGRWNQGCHVSGQYRFKDGLLFAYNNWTYCRYPDRRFQTEITKGWQKGEEVYLRRRMEHEKDLLLGCINTGRFIYNPYTREVIDYSGRFLRKAGGTEHRSITLTNTRLDASAVYPWEDEEEPLEEIQILTPKDKEAEMEEEEEEEVIKPDKKSLDKTKKLTPYIAPAGGKRLKKRVKK